MKATKAPRAQLEKVARELYDREFGRQAPAKVRNARVLVALGEHRPLRWRSHAYRVPPVPFRDGARLLVCSQVLVQASDGDEAGGRALSVAREVMHGLVRVRGFVRKGLRVRRDWVRVPRRNPFRDLSVAEAIGLIDFFLDIPDETPIHAGTAKLVDLKQGFMEAGRVFPFCFDPRNGLPHSWAHYQYALREVGRVLAREELMHAQAARVSQAKKEDWRNYSRQMQSIAGVA